MPSELVGSVDPKVVEQELTWRLCAQDFEYFCRNFWKIPVPKEGWQPLDFDRRPYQFEMAEVLQVSENIVVLKARQIGLTTIAIAYAFWTAFFRSAHDWLMVSVGEDASKKALGRVRQGYSHLPAWMKERGPTLVSDSAQKLAFDNDSKIESLPSTAASGRGDSVYGVIFDEAAHMQDAASVFGALEPLCYGPFIVFSTAKGMGNWFHARWLDSEMADSVWTGVFFPWSAVPERDRVWYETTMRKYVGEEWLFFQEYPSTPEEAFAKSGQVAVSDELLKDQHWCAPEALYEWNPWAKQWEWTDDDTGDVILKVWQEPTVWRDEHNRVVQPPNYVIFCDTAEGLAHGDFNAISVFDANTMEEVAACETRFPIEYLGELLEALGYWYHTALIAVERNNTGLVPITYLSKDAVYPRLFRMPAYGKRKHAERTERYGWLTTVQTKPKMIHDLTKALRDGALTLHNERFRHQSKTFVRDGKGSYNATDGNHDDVVIATMGAYQALLDVGTYPIVWYDTEMHRATWGDVIRAIEGNIERADNPLERPIGVQKQSRGFRYGIQI